MIFYLGGELCAQPEILWNKTYGGSGDEESKWISPTIDGGSIVIGWTNSNNNDVSINYGGLDVWIIKIDRNGILEWEKTYGGSKDDKGHNIYQTKDGGFIALGHSKSNDYDLDNNNGKEDYFLIKLDKNGEKEWSKSYGGSGRDIGKSISILPNNQGYVISGHSTSADGDISINYGDFDYWILKVDTNGNIDWETSAGGGKIDFGYKIIISGEKLYISGQSNSTNNSIKNLGSFDYFITVLDLEGNILNTRNFGGRNDDYTIEIQKDNIGGFILCGHSKSSDKDVTSNKGSEDIWIVKLDEDLNILWERSFGGSFKERSYRIIQDKNNDYIVVGRSESIDGDRSEYFGDFDAWMIKLDKKGDMIWEKSMGGTEFDWFQSGYSMNDYLIVAGGTNSNNHDIEKNRGGHDFWIVKLQDIKKYDSCYYNFEYEDFSDVGGLKILDDSDLIKDTLRLTDDQFFRKGAVYYDSKVGIKNGFETSFTFRLSDGDNHGFIDGSQHGADGIAFVIQGNDSIETGGFGGNIGYGGIVNSLAIEIDAYKNFAKGFEDPDGNHLAIFSNGSDFNSANHTGNGLIAETSDIPTIFQDSIYRCKIIYKDSTLNVYLNSIYEEDNLVLIALVDISKLLILDDYSQGWVGITSSTGNSVEKHDLFSWKFCSTETNYIKGVEDKNYSINIVYPNPNDGNFWLDLNGVKKSFLANSEILIYNSIGELVYRNKSNLNYGMNNLNLGLNAGVYELIIVGNGDSIYSRFIVE